MAQREQTVFRKKSLERVSSPEQLADYIRVTSPGVWLILAAAVILLAGILVWSMTGALETTAEAEVIVRDHTAQVVITGAQADALEAGAPLRVADREAVIASVRTDASGMKTGVAELALPDGTYDGVVVLDSTRPIDFLLESR